MLNDFEGAIYDYDKMIEIDPQHGGAQRRREYCKLQIIKTN